MNLDELKSVRKCNDNVSENNKTWYSSSITLAQKGHTGWGGDEVQKTKRLLITNTTSGPWNLPWKVWRFKSAYTFLTLVYISSLSIFFTSFFFHYFLSLFLHSTKTLSKALVFNCSWCFSSYRWVHFSTELFYFVNLTSSCSLIFHKRSVLNRVEETMSIKVFLSFKRTFEPRK